MKMKMEVDTREENHIKKKKHKKGEASVPENKKCTVDNGSLTEVKKDKKKTKKVETEVIEELWDGGGEKEKKKKKRKFVNESLNDADGSDAMESAKDGNYKKKKKKQQLADDINQVEIAQSPVEEEMEKQQSKGKKVKNKGKKIKVENLKTQKGEDNEEAVMDKVPKKAKKGKKNILVVGTEMTEEQSKEKEKKKKKSTKEFETPEGEIGVEELKKKKKKKKEAKIEEDKNGEETPEDKENNKRRKAASSKRLNEDNILNESKVVIIKEGKTEERKKSKKEKGRKAFVEVSEVEDTEPKTKKRKKESTRKEDPLLVVNEDDGQSRERDDTTGKKNKSSVQRKQMESDFGVEIAAKKKKKKVKKEVVEQLESPQVDVVFLSEKTGNTDEVTINQERRQILQMDIDKASQPENPDNPSGLGQWSTAQFDSSAQQQKFLRLMGGFKKGFQPAAAGTGKANMAMGKNAQQQLQQGLMGEFERAHSRKMDFNNRGAGLGFTAPSNKKFSIDINASRSVRFDE